MLARAGTGEHVLAWGGTGWRGLARALPQRVRGTALPARADAEAPTGGKRGGATDRAEPATDGGKHNAQRALEGSQGATGGRMDWLRWAPWIAAGVALLVRLPHSGQSLWADELYTLRLAQSPWQDIIAHGDQTPPLHALLLHVWIAVAGTSELALRLPSILASAAAAGLAVVVARRYATGAGPLLAGLLVAAHPVLVGQAIEARAYSLLLLLGTLSWLLWLRLGDALGPVGLLRSGGYGSQDAAALPSRRRVPIGLAVAYVLTTAAALYSHAFAGFFVVAQAAAALVTMPRRTWLRLLLLQGCALLLFAPWLGMLLQRATYVAGGFWITPSDLASAKGTFLFWLGTLAIVAHLAAWAIGLFARPRMSRASWVALLAWSAIPAVIPWIVSIWIPVYTPRYAMPAIVGLLVLLAAIVWRLPRATRVTLAVILVAAGVAGSTAFGTMDGEIGRQDWRGAVAFVEHHAAPEDGVLVLPAYCDSTSTEPLATFSCPWGHYGRRTDLDLVPAGVPNRGILEGSREAAMARLANATTVWLVDGTVRPAAPWLEPMSWQGHEVRSWFDEGWRPVGNTTFPRLVVTQYQRL